MIKLTVPKKHLSILRFAFAVSVICHLLFFLGLKLFDLTRPAITPLPKDRISFEVIDGADTKAKVSDRPKSEKSKSIPRKTQATHHGLDRKKMKLRDFSPRFKLESAPTKLSNNTKKSSTSYDKYSDEGAIGVMNSMGIEEAIHLIPHFQAIWSKIDHVLDYPEDFAKQRITGVVNVHLTLDKRGVLIGDFLEINGPEAMLKTYVVALLLHILKSPLPESKWRSKEEPIPVLLSFYFQTYSTYGINTSDTGYQIKNALTFKRLKYVEPKVNEKIRTFYTKYFPPIIPIPGGFYIDFVMAYQMIANYGKPTEEEERRQRLRLLKQNLESSIRSLNSTVAD